LKLSEVNSIPIPNTKSKEPDFNIWNLNQVNLDVSYYPVSKKVNYALNDSKELIDKVV
jgi:hypothetical protein